MKLNSLVLNYPETSSGNYPEVSEFVTPETYAAYYDTIWEPANRTTFSDSRIHTQIEKDDLPLPHEDNRDNYFSGRQLEYWVSGLTDALLVADWRAQQAQTNRPISRYLDFGASSGRVVRHFVKQALAESCYGCDLNTRTINWAKRYIQEACFFNNTIVPYLPFPDDYFEVITAYSVFTHIDLTEDAWLFELRRILQPGGLIALSNHSEAVWHAIDENHFMFASIMMSKPTRPIELTPEMFQSDLPYGKIGFAASEEVANRVNVFRSRDYIQKNWGRLFQIENIIERGHLFHDLVLMRKA